MGWTTPTQRNTGDLITASIWNTDIKDNLRYLKGMDGAITIEHNIIPSTSGSRDLGSGDYLWRAGYLDALYVSNGMMTVHRGTVREVEIDWLSLNPADYQWATGNTGSGDRNPGGTGQWVLEVRENAADMYYFGNQAEQNNAFDTSFNASRSPYGCFPFVLDANDSWLDVWLGFRQTLGTGLPNPAAENYAGLHFDGATWYCECADGSTETQESISAPAAAQWHVFEILIVSATSVIFAVDGTIVKTLTTNLPTGDLDWTVFYLSDGGGGGATISYMTIGKLLFQESLS